MKHNFSVVENTVNRSLARMTVVYVQASPETVEALKHNYYKPPHLNSWVLEW